MSYDHLLCWERPFAFVTIFALRLALDLLSHCFAACLHEHRLGSPFLHFQRRDTTTERCTNINHESSQHQGHGAIKTFMLSIPPFLGVAASLSFPTVSFSTA